MSKHKTLLFISLSFLFSFWGSFVRAEQTWSDTPPQISEAITATEQNRRLFVWDRPSAFGKVPPDRQAIGDFICAKGRIDMQATGFHPQAKNSDGLEIPGGGYLCERKPSGDRPQALPPKLTRVSGVTGWDRPAAFGRVPEALITKGRSVCGAMGPNMDAIGFHPEAANAQGKKIRGGGFLCGPAAQF